MGRSTAYPAEMRGWVTGSFRYPGCTYRRSKPGVSYMAKGHVETRKPFGKLGREGCYVILHVVLLPPSPPVIPYSAYLPPQSLCLGLPPSLHHSVSLLLPFSCSNPTAFILHHFGSELGMPFLGPGGLGDAVSHIGQFFFCSFSFGAE